MNSLDIQTFFSADLQNKVLLDKFLFAEGYFVNKIPHFVCSLDVLIRRKRQ